MKTNTTLPRLRFPEFKNSSSWRKKKLIDVTDENAKWSFIGGPFGSNLKASDYTSDGIRVIQLQNIGDGEFSNDSEIYTSEEKANELLANNIYPHDIILSKMGDPVGRACLIPDTHDRYVMCSDGIRLVVDEQHYNKYFIYSFINSDTFRTAVERKSTGSTRKRIGLSHLKKLPLLIPSLAEQQKIADCLASLDTLLSAESQQFDSLQTYKSGLLQQLFPAEGETVPKVRFDGFKGDWEKDNFDEVIKIIDGDRGKNYPKSHEFKQSGYCVFLSAKNVTKKGFSFDIVQFITIEKDKAMTKGKLKRNDVVLTTRGSIGHFAYYSRAIGYKHIRINSGMVLLRAEPDIINAQYLYYFCQSPVLTQHIENVSYGNAQQQLTVKGIKEFIINYPSLPEQQEIADCLSSLDSLIEAQAIKIDTLKQHKQGLMQQLFPLM